MKFIKFSFIFILILQSLLLSQVKIKELPSYNLAEVDSQFFGISDSRKLISLNDGWNAYTEGNENNKVRVSVPSNFTGVSSIFFEKEFEINSEQLLNNNISIHFLGLNYSAEIYLNELLILKHPGGEFPFTISLNSDVLQIGSNKLLVKLNYKLDSESTIPLKQRFLFPQNFGGIIKDVYLHLEPLIRVNSDDISYKLNSKYSIANFTSTFSSHISKELRELKDDKKRRLVSKIRIEVWLPDDTTATYSREKKVRFNKQNNAKAEFKFRIRKPSLWSPQNPVQYKFIIKFFHGDMLLDKLEKDVPVYTFENRDGNFYLNNVKFEFDGTTYIYTNLKYGNLIPYEDLKKDLAQIKNTGFNSVRFSKSLPNPYALELCTKLGMFAFVELPLNSLPESFASESSMLERAKSQLNYIIDGYANFPSLAAIGVGSSYLPNSDIENDFISKLGKIIKEKTNKISYASFIGIPDEEIENIDLMGLEIFVTGRSQYKNILNSSHENYDPNKLFISEVTYPVYLGSSNGYLNNNTYEAQAKVFDQIIDIVRTKKLNGFFINSFMDYYGEYSSNYTGFTKDGLYKIGITGEDRGTNRLSYKVLQSKLKKTEKVTIPIGSKSDDSPILFIIVGLVLSLLTALLINSKRQFRQDATRSLLRPYNFYADIRDHRILSGLHAVILMFILAGAHSLLITNLLYFLRTNILLEKILISFGSPGFMHLMGFLAWNPTEAIIYLFGFSIILFAIFTIGAKLASYSIKKRVLFSNIFFVVVWSFLPLVLLLPVELVLYKILISNSVNILIYILLLFYALWLIQRLMKGIYVIFDVHPGQVYFYSILILIVLFGSVMLFFQFSDSSVYYIINALKQYQIMI